MRRLAFISLILLVSPWSAFAQTTQPTIILAADLEDGHKMVHAIVTLNGKPLENVTLRYFVQRMFGRLQIGLDTTLDDGTSAVAFPSDLPGSSNGQLHVVVRIKTPEKYAAISASRDFLADVRTTPIDDAFPRTLWAPNAPLALMLSIFAMLAAVWLSYFFVIGRILAIRIGGQK